MMEYGSLLETGSQQLLGYYNTQQLRLAGVQTVKKKYRHILLARARNRKISTERYNEHKSQGIPVQTVKAPTNVRIVSQHHLNIGTISGIKHLAGAEHVNNENFNYTLL